MVQSTVLFSAPLQPFCLFRRRSLTVDEFRGREIDEKSIPFALPFATWKLYFQIQFHRWIWLLHQLKGYRGVTFAKNNQRHRARRNVFAAERLCASDI